MNLTRFVDEASLYLFAQFDVDKRARTFRMLDEGFFGENLARAYYKFKGYREVGRENNSERES